MTRPVQNCALLLASLVLAGCANQSYVALLENDDGTTGKVQITTPYGSTLLNSPRQATRIDGPSGETYIATPEKLNKDFGVAMKAAPAKPVTYLLYFDLGGSTLTPESEAEVAKILDAIGTRSVPDVSVIGHTDTVGDDGANEALALERARFVTGLIAAGNKIDPAKIVVESHGKRNLLVPTPDNTEEVRNRRVEVTIR
jgi:outer membrane protein OmpA-like peptidoglycan-associated protein